MRNATQYFPIVTSRISEQQQGYLCILLASVAAGTAGVPYFAAYRTEPALSLWSGSFVRVLANCLFVVGSLLSGRSFRSLFGNRENGLWVWGILGSLTVTTYFASIVYLGAGMAQLFAMLSVFVITFFRPYFLGQKNGVRIWIALIGSSSGFLLLHGNHSLPRGAMGITFAISSAVFCGLAYLMAARAGRRNDSIALMTYWCVCALAVHSVLVLQPSIQWPQSFLVWGYLLLAGLLSSIAQFLTTIAYQKAPAAPVAAMGYVAPVIGIGFDWALFGLVLNGKLLAGIFLVLGFGVLLPFLRDSN